MLQQWEKERKGEEQEKAEQMKNAEADINPSPASLSNNHVTNEEPALWRHKSKQ
jgi:hypothetical protein